MASLNALSARRDPAAASSVKQAAAEALQKATNATALVVRFNLRFFSHLSHDLRHYFASTAHRLGLSCLVPWGDVICCVGRGSTSVVSKTGRGAQRTQVNKPTDGVVVVKETRRFAGKDIEARKKPTAQSTPRRLPATVRMRLSLSPLLLRRGTTSDHAWHALSRNVYQQIEKTYEAGTKAAKEALKRTAVCSLARPPLTLLLIQLPLSLTLAVALRCAAPLRRHRRGDPGDGEETEAERARQDEDGAFP